MIAPLPGWSWSWTAGGAALRAPDGAPIVIEYSEHVRPVRPITELVAAVVAAVDGFEPDHGNPPERIFTAECEYGAHATVRGHRAGAPCQIDAGFVIVDDVYSRLVVVADDPADFGRASECVRTLLVGDLHWRAVRPRRFWYQPPPRWRAIERPGQLDWHPPEFPSRPLALTVWRAAPRRHGATSGAFVETLLRRDAARGWAPLKAAEERRVRTGSRLDGLCLRLNGAAEGRASTERDIVVLEDTRWVYPLRLERAGGFSHGDAEILDRVVESVRPFPDRDQPQQAVAALSHWCM